MEWKYKFDKDEFDSISLLLKRLLMPACIWKRQKCTICSQGKFVSTRAISKQFLTKMPKMS
eukprot:43541-Ditylum_brightwellii.AAC.1